MLSIYAVGDLENCQVWLISPEFKQLKQDLNATSSHAADHGRVDSFKPFYLSEKLFFYLPSVYVSLRAPEWPLITFGLLYLHFNQACVFSWIPFSRHSFTVIQRPTNWSTKSWNVPNWNFFSTQPKQLPVSVNWTTFLPQTVQILHTSSMHTKCVSTSNLRQPPRLWCTNCDIWWTHESLNSFSSYLMIYRVEIECSPHLSSSLASRLIYLSPTHPPKKTV